MLPSCGRAINTTCSPRAEARWVSSDFVDWKYHAVEVRGARVPVAPHVTKYRGAFYMSGNSAPLYKAAEILGPYELVGPWMNEKGEPWKGLSNGHP